MTQQPSSTDDCRLLLQLIGRDIARYWEQRSSMRIFVQPLSPSAHVTTHYHQPPDAVPRRNFWGWV